MYIPTSFDYARSVLGIVRYCVWSDDGMSAAKLDKVMYDITIVITGITYTSLIIKSLFAAFMYVCTYYSLD